MSRHGVWLVAWLLLGGVSRAAADVPSGEEPASSGEPTQEEPDYLALADAPVFLPRSYLYWGTPVGPSEQREPLVFALSYALHLPVYNDLRDQALAGKAWAGAATISFEGDLRMLSISSKPVRMPSYRPSISGQLFYIVQREALGMRDSSVALDVYEVPEEVRVRMGRRVAAPPEPEPEDMVSYFTKLALAPRADHLPDPSKGRR